MMEFLVHYHNHAGWKQSTETAESADAAIKLAIIRHHGFLEAEYSGQYSIEVNPGCTRYNVKWQGINPKPIFGGYLWSGGPWFSGEVRIGEKDDCPKCGGTGVNHYNTFMQCWACGNSKKKGRGSGKTQNAPVRFSKLGILHNGMPGLFNDLCAKLKERPNA